MIRIPAINRKGWEVMSAISLATSFLQFFFSSPTVGIPLFFALLILASLTGELSMTNAEQAKLLESRREMAKHGPSY